MSDREDQLTHLRLRAEALRGLAGKLYDSVLGLEPVTALYLNQDPDPQETRKLLAQISRVTAEAEGYLSEWER